MSNKFLVSVANAVIRNASTGEAIAYGKTNIESSFELSTAETEVRGGINNPLLYTYIHDRSLTVNINEATFSATVLGLNVGQLAQNGSVSVTQTDCVVLTSGSGVLSCLPTGNVSIFLPNGTVEEVTPSGSSIFVSGGADSKIDAIYITSKTADQITVETTTPPSVVDLTLIGEVRDDTGSIVEYLQINVPRFQVMGNYSLSLSADGVSQQALNGKALAVASTDCVSGEYYAKVTWIPASATSTPVSSIAAIPSTVQFSMASLPSTQQLSVLGIRGGIYQNANVTSSCTFAKVSGSASLSINTSTGLITAASSGSAGHTAMFSATYYTATTGSLIDYVKADIIA